MKQVLDISFTSEDDAEEEEGNEQDESSQAVNVSYQKPLPVAAVRSECPSVAHNQKINETEEYKSFRDRVKAALAVDPVFKKLADELMFN